MQGASSKYKIALARPQKAVVYLVELEGMTTRYSTGPVLSPTGPIVQALSAPQLASSQITPDEAKASVGGAVFRIADLGMTITKQLPGWIALNKTATIKQGFVEIPEESYSTIYKGRIANMTCVETGTAWEFSCQDFSVYEKTAICQAATVTVGTSGSSDTTINVKSTDGFAAATAGVAFLRIDDEVISYTGKTSTSFTGCVRGISYLPGITTTAAGHADQVDVAPFYYIEGNGIDLALKIMTSTGAGTGGAYDVLPADIGLAIPAGYIDVAKFESERNKWLLGYNLRFYLQDKEEGKQFIESQIYQFSNAFPVTNNLGQISVKVYAPPLPTQTMQSFTDDNCELPPQWSSSIYSRYFWNELVLDYDYNPLVSGVTGATEYATRGIYEDSTSQVKYGSTSKPLIVTKALKSRGIYTDLMGEPKIGHIAERFLKRFSNPTPTLEIKSFMTGRLAELGDVALVSTNYTPDPNMGRLGFQNKLAEIISREEDTTRGALKLTALDTSYSYGRKYGAISPSTQSPSFFPNYMAATASQRLYAFWGLRNTVGKNFMSNGDDGYYITP